MPTLTPSTKKGLRISGASGDRIVPIDAYEAPPACVVDLVVIAVKAAHIGAASESAKQLLASHTKIVTIQNGLGSAAVVAGMLGPDQLIVGIAQGFGASMPEPGHAHHEDMKAIRMGAYAQLPAVDVEEVTALWQHAGFDTEAVTDVTSIAWDKLICNVAFSAPCALTGLTVGAAINNPQMQSISEAAAREAYDVALELDVALDFTNPNEHIRNFADRMPNAKPSVLLDIEAGRPSEVGVINGAVVREANKVGLSAPVNATLTNLVQVMEQQQNESEGKAALLLADQSRREAMISNDTQLLGTLLADNLKWTHSSGRTDGKAELLESIEAQTVEYLKLDVSEVEVCRYTDVYTCCGVLDGLVNKAGEQSELKNKFLSVWKQTNNLFQMLAWQSTRY